MDKESQGPAKLFSLLADGHEAMIEFNRHLWAYVGPKNVSCGCILRACQGRRWFETWVEAHLSNGDDACWMFELAFSEDHWEIDVSVTITNDKVNSEPVVEFPARRAETFDEVCRQIPEAIKEVLSCWDFVRRQ